MSAEVRIFGVRHLSPGASKEILALCESFRPDAVLVEGPVDAMDTMAALVRPETVPPVAVLAYTTQPPVKSFTLPFAAYSPEYNAITWALTHDAAAEFIDLPSGVFLAMRDEDEETAPVDEKEDEESKDAPLSVLPDHRESPYERWAKAAGYDSFESYWEAVFEHLDSGYEEASMAFGAGLRSMEDPPRQHLLRESFMRRCLRAAEGKYGRILVVCGAYHASVLGPEHPAMTDEELAALPTIPSMLTLMPYSYLRLSSKSGYGAGNMAPLYYETLWHHRESLDKIPAYFFASMAAIMREKGVFRSPAEVIEAVILTRALAQFNNHPPLLEDLRSAAITLLGRGEKSAVAEALAYVETGTAIGSLPDNIGRTAIQDDFYRELAALRLDRYRSTVAQDLVLDLREKLTSEKGALTDRRRSAFLHRLTALDLPFATAQASGQTKAGWKESWVLRWTPEAEIVLVESSLRGESVRMAAGHLLEERLKNADSVAISAELLNQALLCDLPEVYELVLTALQARAVDTESFENLTDALRQLSRVLRYGTLRDMDTSSAVPLLEQLFLRCCLLLCGVCRCNPDEARSLSGRLQGLHQVYIDHSETLDDEHWLRALRELAQRDDLSPLMSGYACALLLEMGKLEEGFLELEVHRRLSLGVPADLGAGWFEGLSGRNRYGLLSRMTLWRALDEYLQALDEDAYLRALVFLRRGFSAFSVQEKRMIFENLSVLWGVTQESVEDALAVELTEQDQADLESLNDMDFSMF